jgi:hypothetical protein
MKSWKTTIGGSLTAAGTFLWGAPLAMGALKVPVPIPPWLFSACVIGGLLLSVGGVFCTGLYARDNDKSSEEVGAAKPQSVPVKLMCFFLLSWGVTGCAQFHSYQKESKPDGSIVEQRHSVTTFLDGKSEIAKLRASTTDKTQGLTVGGISEESSSQVVETIIKAAVSAAASAAK